MLILARRCLPIGGYGAPPEPQLKGMTRPPARLPPEATASRLLDFTASGAASTGQPAKASTEAYSEAQEQPKKCGHGQPIVSRNG